MSEVTTAYVLLSQSRREGLRQHVAETLLHWRQTWSPSTTFEPTIEVLSEPSQALGEQHQSTTVYSACFGGNHESFYVLLANQILPKLLGSLVPISTTFTDLFPENNDYLTRLKEEIVTSFCQGLLVNIDRRDISLTRMSDSPGELISRALQQRCEFIQVTYDNGKVAMTIAMPTSLVEMLAPRNVTAASDESLSKRRTALLDDKVGVETILGYSEVSLRELARLRPGDVIVLSESLTQPCELRTQNGRPIAEATLGSTDGKRAIRIGKVNALKVGANLHVDIRR